MIPPDSSNLWSQIDTEHCLYMLEQLERRVLSLPERGMRRTLVVEFASSLTPTGLVFVLSTIQYRASMGQGNARDLLQEFALEPSAISQLPYDTLKEAYQAAADRGLVSVQGLFFAGQSVEESRPIQKLDEQGISTNEHLELPLGIRRQAARENDRMVLDRLVHDQNWRVIDLLLDNPRIIERDVVRIAARRPTQPAIIELVAKHPKWSGRYRVRKAIVCNPKTPYALARSLLDTMLQQDLMEVIQLGVLSPQLMDEARVLMRKRQTQQSRNMEDAFQEMEDLISQFDDELQQEADWVSDLEQQEQEEADDWMETVTQGLIDGTLPLVPVGEEPSQDDEYI